MPTGIKTGVLTVQCGSVRSQALALVTGHSATILRVRAEAVDETFFKNMVLSTVLLSSPHSKVAAIFQRLCDVKGQKLTLTLTNQ